MTNAFKIVLVSALITTAAIKAAPALAEPASPVTSIVQTFDLNLSTSSGQRQLDLRLARAAREACGTASAADLKGKNAVRKCRDEVLAQAEVQRRQLLGAATDGETIAIASAR